MRPLIMAFIVYFIALHFVPCGDHFHYFQDQQAVISEPHVCHTPEEGCINELAAQEQEAHNDTHHCSPLCVCGCCHMAISDQVVSTFNLSEELLALRKPADYQPDYCNHYIHNHQNTIFQPPKGLYS